MLLMIAMESFVQGTLLIIILTIIGAVNSGTPFISLLLAAVSLIVCGVRYFVKELSCR